jgi:hypothetical protein
VLVSSLSDNSGIVHTNHLRPWSDLPTTAGRMITQGLHLITNRVGRYRRHRLKIN